jgi:hypothetical protein
MNELNNAARIAEESNGMYRVLVQVWTKIANPKRQRLLMELILRQFSEIEQVVAKMPYEDVDRILNKVATSEVEPPPSGSDILNFQETNTEQPTELKLVDAT